MDGFDGFDGSRVLGRSPSSLDRIKAVLMQADFSEDLGRMANLDAPPHVMGRRNLFKCHSLNLQSTASSLPSYIGTGSGPDCSNFGDSGNLLRNLRSLSLGHRPLPLPRTPSLRIQPAWVPHQNRAAIPSAVASLASPPSWSGVAKAVLEAAAAQGEGEVPMPPTPDRPRGTMVLLPAAGASPLASSSAPSPQWALQLHRPSLHESFPEDKEAEEEEEEDQGVDSAKPQANGGKEGPEADAFEASAADVGGEGADLGADAAAVVQQAEEPWGEEEGSSQRISSGVWDSAAGVELVGNGEGHEAAVANHPASRLLF
ncbi:hypothetical protein QJQ45_025995, partial [Haematococcus lacustris]